MKKQLFRQIEFKLAADAYNGRLEIHFLGCFVQLKVTTQFKFHFLIFCETLISLAIEKFRSVRITCIIFQYLSNKLLLLLILNSVEPQCHN